MDYSMQYIHVGLVLLVASVICGKSHMRMQNDAPECPLEDDHLSGWWTYDGFSGPNSWHTKSEFAICGHGKNQSPIDIRPQTLLYDPHLKPLKIEAVHVNGTLRNTGRDLTYIISGPHVNVTSGPLSYTYRLYQIKFHFGMEDGCGSEHSIDGKYFPGEIHFMAYNSDLYSNETEAQNNPRGLAIIAVFLQINSFDQHLPFEMFKKRFPDVHDKYSCADLPDLPIQKLLPQTQQYMTYSGSLTQPGCKETVTWIVYNKPMQISKSQMNGLRRGFYQEWTKKNNTRPIMPLNHRTVRTNINVKNPTKLCTMEVHKSYKVNPDIKH